jgi:hypothetical protein
MALPNPDLPFQRPTSGAEPAGRPGASGKLRPIPLQTDNSPQQVPEVYEEDVEEHGDLREVLRNAPAWLVSSVFHMSLLIILGIVAVTTHLKREVNVSVSYAEPEGTQMEDPSVLEGDSPRLENPHDEQVITPSNLPPVADPLASPIEVGEIKLGAGPALFTGPTTIAGAPIGLALKGRQIGSKRVLIGKYGGTKTTQEAVETGLEWLAKQQKADGTWSLVGPFADGSRSENVAAATAMALLAFQGNGNTHREGKYAKNVARGWSALLKLQRDDGHFNGTMSETNQILYTHAQCSIALCELYGMTMDSLYRKPAERAIAYAVSCQDKVNGGWRYTPGDDSDTSVTGWFVMALQSARMARLAVPEETLKLVSNYLDKAQIEGGRRYGYWFDRNPSSAVSAEGLLCRQYLGWHQDDPRLVAGVSALNQVPIQYDGGLNQDVYYWYYATQATHHMEGKIWDDWNKVMRVELPAHQTKNGAEAGSWSSTGDKWSTYGRLYTTCLSIYILEVYYRHLPIYSGYRAMAGVAPSDDAKPPQPPDNATPDGAAPESGNPVSTDGEKTAAPDKPAADKPSGGEKPAAAAP